MRVSKSLSTGRDFFLGRGEIGLAAGVDLPSGDLYNYRAMACRLLGENAAMTGVSQGGLFSGIGTESGAIFSPCEKWRYVLWRVWDSELPILVSIGLNPSTADAVWNDRTVSKMIKYSKSLGYGSIIKLNVYAWRSKSPKEMKRQGVAAIGDLNDYWIQAVEQTFGPAGRDVIGMRIACWGQNDFLNRGAVIQQYVPDLHHFGLNDNGTPKHPLYLPLGSICPERLCVSE